MKDYNKDSDQDRFIGNLLQNITGGSDEELLDEFEAACNLHIPLPSHELLSDEFEEIWARIQEERTKEEPGEDSEEEPDENSGENTEDNANENIEEKKNFIESRHANIIRGRFSWKRLAAIGLIACLTVGSGCMVAMGTKSYFYRESKAGAVGNDKVLDNDMNKVKINGEEAAYSLIEENLGIRPLRLGYIPSDMKFLEVLQGEGIVYIKFKYGGNMVYLVQSKYGKEVSSNLKSDSKGQVVYDVYNKWLRKTIEVKSEMLDGGKKAYETSIITGGSCYSLLGTMEGAVFDKMVEELLF